MSSNEMAIGQYHRLPCFTQSCPSVSGIIWATPPMIDQLLNILTLGIKPLYEKNLTYYKIIRDFREKLPRPQNNATPLSPEDQQRIGLPALQGVNVVDLSTFRTSLSEADVDLFYNKLEYFDYSFVLFPNYYRKFTSNLKRFKPKAENKDFELFMVQQVLKENPLKPLKPIPVLVHHLKWEIKWTSQIYIWFRKRIKKGRHLR